MIPLRYRLANVKSLSEVLPLNRELLAQDGHEPNLFTDEYLANRLAAWISSGHVLLLLEAGGVLVGYALYLPGVRETGENIVYLRHFLIAQAERRKGFGRRAMIHLLKFVWPPDAMICVDTQAANVAAIAFWRALKFEIYSHSFALNANCRRE